MTTRRFPPPWSAEVTPNCFIVRDADGQQLAYVYYESEPGRRSAAKLLSEDEARRIVANGAKLGTAILMKYERSRHRRAEDRQVPEHRSLPRFAWRVVHFCF